MTRPRLAEGAAPPPHPEGGWFRQTWASPVIVTLPDGRVRPTATLIHFLLPAGESSAWHRVSSDEVWLAHLGEVRLQLGGDGAAPVDGPEHLVGVTSQAQLVVPAGAWQRTLPGPEDALVSCLLSPGFDFDDFELAELGAEPGDRTGQPRLHPATEVVAQHLVLAGLDGVEDLPASVAGSVLGRRRGPPCPCRGSRRGRRPPACLARSSSPRVALVSDQAAALEASSRSVGSSSTHDSTDRTLTRRRRRWRRGSGRRPAPPSSGPMALSELAAQRSTPSGAKTDPLSAMPALLTTSSTSPSRATAATDSGLVTSS